MAPDIRITSETLEHLTGLGFRDYELLSESSQETQEQPVIYNPNPQDYIFVSGIKSGKEKRPDLLVCKYRLGMSPEVEQAGNQLGLNLQNTTQEENKRDYIGSINREQALKLNLYLGGRTSDIRLARDFLKLLFSGEAVDGEGNTINPTELIQIANEITQPRSPWRAEWFEDYFTQGDEGLVLNKHYVLNGKDIKPEYSNPLTNCLMQDKTPGIDLQSWLKNSTAQGFPNQNTKQGNLYFWHPRQDFASRFYAGPYDADLGCYRDPLYSDSGLGVRHVREAHVKK